MIEALVGRLQAAVGESPIRPVLMLTKFCGENTTRRAMFKAGAVRLRPDDSHSCPPPPPPPPPRVRVSVYLSLSLSLSLPPPPPPLPFSHPYSRPTLSIPNTQVSPLLNLAGPNQKPFLRDMALFCLQSLCIHAGNQGPLLATEGLLETLRQATLIDVRPEHALSRLRAAQALSCLISEPPDMRRNGSEAAAEHQAALIRLVTGSWLMPDILRALNDFGNDEITMDWPFRPLGHMEEEERAGVVSRKIPNMFAKHGMSFMRIPCLPLATFLTAMWRIIIQRLLEGLPIDKAAEIWEGCSREQLVGAGAVIRTAAQSGHPQLMPLRQLIGKILQFVEIGIEES